MLVTTLYTMRRVRRGANQGPPYDKTYHVSIESVPLFNQMLHRLYHWYDMRIPTKVPGWNLVEKVLRHFGAEIRALQAPGDPDPRWRDRPLGWTIRQDLRCYELSQRNRKSLHRIEVTEEQWRLLSEESKKDWIPLFKKNSRPSSAKSGSSSKASP